MTNILLSGCSGYMGRVITALVAKRDDCRIAAGLDPVCSGNSGYPVYSDVSEIKEDIDVIIDFSHVSALPSLLSYADRNPGCALVLCTTGYTPEQVTEIKAQAEKSPVFYSRNMSLGINLLIELSKKARAVLGDDFDVEIVEKHHNRKIDAPSGTALMIADAISSVSETDMAYTYDRQSVRKKREKSEIGISSVRGGTIVGEHEVIFAGNNELLTISHSAQSRDLFASGAVNAAVYMNGKGPGLYDMSDLLK